MRGARWKREAVPADWLPSVQELARPSVRSVSDNGVSRVARRWARHASELG